MLISEAYELLIGEGLAVVLIWGIPSWLVFRAWRRYRRLDPVQPSLRIAMSSLLVSLAMLMLVGVIVAVEMASRMRMPSSPQAIGFTNVLLCVIALLTPFVGKTRDTIHVRRATTTASIYMIFVWLYAMLAH